MMRWRDPLWLPYWFVAAGLMGGILAVSPWYAYVIAFALIASLIAIADRGAR